MTLSYEEWSTGLTQPVPLSGLEVEVVKAYVNAPETDNDYIATCLNEALGLVGKFVGNALVPEAILDRAVLETAAALYHRKNTQNGLVGYTGEGQPIYSAKDPMNTVYPLLRKYVLPF